MDTKDLKIVVTGDICIDWLQWKTEPKENNTSNWRNHTNMNVIAKGGGALLLSSLVDLAIDGSLISPQIEDIDAPLPKKLLRSTSELELFPGIIEKNNKDKVYRVKNFLGYTGPSTGDPKLLPIVNDDVDADVVIIDDENNGFNSNKDFWPLTLKSTDTSPIVIYKMNNPIEFSDLWKQVEKYHIKNTVLVIGGDDLRSKGVNISKSLSWEKTALDFIWQINNNPNIAFIAKCHHLVIPFGLEGAIYYRNDGVAKSQLYFLPNEFEGGFIKEPQGKIYGLTSCFVAGLARSIVSGKRNNEELSKSIGEGIREGIVSAQKYFVCGFGENVEEFTFPNPAIFTEEKDDFIYKENIQDVLIRNSTNPNCQSCWYIIKDNSSINLTEIAYDIVKNGAKSALKFIPIATFGKLKAVDRAEIEGYRSIKNLMREYVSAKNTEHPLCISVFGTPGSGKSFGVTEVASSIAPEIIEKLNFNLSQFQSIGDLITAFHKVRDISLTGKVPLVFFDEFDSAFDGKLGWLKYFLAPMQDGVFREGDAIHPIGKSIFVFAGGTSITFKEFCGEDIKDEGEHKEFLSRFQNSKGPDFVSRLRGYVNILGPNQTEEQWDQLFVIRRAMLLRSLLERKTPHLINERGEAQIDNGVLRALLKVPRYKHESRSMEAILEMSMLTNARKWEQSHLPSKEQLKLHVDEEQFLRNLMHDTFFSEKIEKLAMAIHYNDIILCEDRHKETLSYFKEWEDIDKEIKNSIRDQVRHIPNALHKINYEVISVKEKPEAINFTENEVNILAEYEHKRWSLVKKEDGWKYGNILDEKKKIHPALVVWDKLPANSKNNIIENIKSWPYILANSNFTIERLKSLCKCEIII